MIFLQSKKICFIVAAFSDGGVNRVISNLANNFVDRGIHVDVVVLSSKFSQAKHLYKSQVNLINLSGSRTLSFLPLMKYFLKHKTYDAIISSVEFVNIHTIIAHKLAKLHSKLIVVTHTDLVQEKIQKKMLILKIVYKLASILYPYSNKVCAVSKGVSESIYKVLKLDQDVQVIYNPIVHMEDLDYTPKTVPHPWYSEDIPVFLGCGRLTKQKNFQILISAFKKLTLTQNVRLIILGEGELREDLERQIEILKLDDYVHMFGKTSNPLDFYYYSKSLVVSSLWEGFGNVIVEALSMGCPVISTDCPSGPAEILGDVKWGKLVEMNNEEELYLAMKDELLKSRVNRLDLQERAKDFMIDKIADQYLALVYTRVDNNE